MHSEKLRHLTLAALFAALACTATLLIQIPAIPPAKGYINLGDCIVNVAAWVLGPVFGAAAAGIGSALADIISGYVIYAPATLVIKALMAVVAWYVYQAAAKRFHSLPSRIAAVVASEIYLSSDRERVCGITGGSFCYRQ